MTFKSEEWLRSASISGDDAAKIFLKTEREKQMIFQDIIKKERDRFRFEGRRFAHRSWEGMEHVFWVNEYIKDNNLPIDVSDDISRIIDCLEKASDVFDELSEKILQAYEAQLKGGGQNQIKEEFEP